MTDESGEIHVGETVRIRQDKDWYQRPAGLIFLVSLGLSLLLFAAGTVVDRVSYSHRNEDLRQTADVLLRKNNALTESNNALNDELKCRSQRNADVAAITSRITGQQAQLVVLIIQRVQDPSVYTPILEDLQSLAEQREAAERRLRTAVEECQKGG